MSSVKKVRLASKIRAKLLIVYNAQGAGCDRTNPSQHVVSLLPDEDQVAERVDASEPPQSMVDLRLRCVFCQQRVERTARRVERGVRPGDLIGRAESDHLHRRFVHAERGLAELRPRVVVFR